ncbi:hypothetical protein BVG16_26980 [Paenibacillus selenitireducens]|uniref:DinB-like domain-containing protein n=1 Tax=Paenibacillus selenitireducens TaxID=1324314 RepID=A0A1T2X1Z7_9BACL|nr:DinB family protein [Paenibacillus selenitireducens]OPA73736.1 hypothetical protein BVG16_26980 [Paenibacillus selenitireducens]
MLQRPVENEFPYYFGPYIELVPEGHVLDLLDSQLAKTISLFSSLTEEQLNFRYAEGKWSLKEVLGHMSDTERVMSYRLLCLARGEKGLLPGFDEEDYMLGANFGSQSISGLVEEYEIVRRSTLSLCRGIDDEAWQRIGNTNGHDTSARALPYIIAGHELHHLRIIKERYLSL